MSSYILTNGTDEMSVQDLGEGFALIGCSSFFDKLDEVAVLTRNPHDGRSSAAILIRGDIPTSPTDTITFAIGIRLEDKVGITAVEATAPFCQAVEVAVHALNEFSPAPTQGDDDDNHHDDNYDDDDDDIVLH